MDIGLTRDREFDPPGRTISFNRVAALTWFRQVPNGSVSRKGMKCGWPPLRTQFLAFQKAA